MFVSFISGNGFIYTRVGSAAQGLSPPGARVVEQWLGQRVVVCLNPRKRENMEKTKSLQTYSST